MTAPPRRGDRPRSPAVDFAVDVDVDVVVDPAFQTVAIYSVGLLGGSIGAGLKKSGFAGKIVGLSSENGLKIAADMGLIDEGRPYSDLPKIVGQVDLLILCSPVLAIIKTIEELGAMDLPEGLVITDIGSTKKAIIDAANKHLPSSVHFVGGHPMAGSEKSGPSASDPDIFRDAVYVLTPAKDDDASSADKLATFLRGHLGCNTVTLDPQSHDRIVAAISHLPHILASALVLHAQEHEKQVPGTLSLAASGFRDMTRIASTHYDIWHDIFSTNKEAVAPLIDSYIRILEDMKKKLSNDTLRDDFEAAREVRMSMF